MSGRKGKPGKTNKAPKKLHLGNCILKEICQGYRDLDQNDTTGWISNMVLATTVVGIGNRAKILIRGRERAGLQYSVTFLLYPGGIQECILN